MTDPVVLAFAVLSAISGIRHGFVCRVPGLDVAVERQAALDRLAAIHREVLRRAAVPPLRRVEQVHGGEVAIVDSGSPEVAARADALVTRDPEVTLGIFVADCCAVYLVDPRLRAIGLIHSGKKGTKANIAGRSVQLMVEAFGTDPADLVAQLSPCIRPPEYEIDFAAEIRRQLAATGVGRIVDDGQNTGTDLTRFYSYRKERGKTGRMLAYLATGRAQRKPPHGATAKGRMPQAEKCHK
ncbi:MAG: polyphenol oxidase family protein [Verrucomicrobia bacterium]|nr:polyphenol oxidase family protein [Verrucomicrobiota bacterium]